VRQTALNRENLRMIVVDYQHPSSPNPACQGVAVFAFSNSLNRCLRHRPDLSPPLANSSGP
jgi:hypothetical protein